MIRLDDELKLRKQRALAVEAKLRAGVRYKDVADVQRIGVAGGRNPVTRLDHGPGAQVQGVQNSLFHGGNDGRKVRRAGGGEDQ